MTSIRYKNFGTVYDDTLLNDVRIGYGNEYPGIPSVSFISRTGHVLYYALPEILNTQYQQRRNKLDTKLKVLRNRTCRSFKYAGDFADHYSSIKTVEYQLDVLEHETKQILSRIKQLNEEKDDE